METPRPLSEDEQICCAQLYAEGLSDTAIGRRLKRSQSCIRRWRVGKNLPVNVHHRNPQAGRIIQLVRGSYSTEEIAQLLSMTTRSVSDVLQAHEQRQRINNLPVRPYRKRLTKRQHKQMLAMHARGCSDNEIAQAFGKTKENISIWRKRNNLAVNSTRVLVEDNQEVERLYAEGKTDAEISKIIGCSYSTIWSWRKRNGLPSNSGRKA